MKYLIIFIMGALAALAWGCRSESAEESAAVAVEAFASEDCCTKHLECQDGIWCNGVEYCNCWGVCISGDPVDCTDGNPNTSDACINDYIGVPGVRGTGGSPGVDGEIGTGHCENEFTGTPCTTDAECDDANVCTDDVCVGGLCSHTNIVCDDGDVCTSDSCDAGTGCVYIALQNCCTADADCDDGSVCTSDVCNLTFHMCQYFANAGTVCDYPDDCYDPGTCQADGLCHPGSLRTPANDQCAGVIDVILSDIGEACVTGTTNCAVHDYNGSCATGMNADVTYRFTYPSRLGAPLYQNGADHTGHGNDTCHNLDGTAVWSCTNNWWEFTFNFANTGGYRAGIETNNADDDLTVRDIKHRVQIYLDGVLKGEVSNPATNPDFQQGSIYLGYVSAGVHTVRYQWVNDWNDPPLDSNIRVNRVWIQQDDNAYQLYSYNVMVDAEFDAVLYAQRSCGDQATEIACNNNCVTTSIMNCGGYGLAFTDPGFNLPPAPVGAPGTIYFIVDGKLGERGDFELKMNRVMHRNNPCSTMLDSVRRVDATAGGEYRGNIDGYVNDMLDSSFNWLKTTCHSASAAASDWPASAWFVLKPDRDTTYRIWTDETTPTNWFDTVITVWENTSALGCRGSKNYMGCAHVAGQNGPDSPTQYQALLSGGRIYMVGISRYDRPTAGNYIVHFDIL